MWIVLWHSIPSLLQGMLINIELLLCLILAGLALGIGVALIQVYGPRMLVGIAVGYGWFFRGVPEIVLLMLIYFGLRQFGVKLSPFFAAVVALGLRSSAYQSQIFRGAMQALDRGQTLAALSLGMTKLQIIRCVILPQALRLSMPPWSNEFTGVFKDTTLAYTIGVVEVLRKARYVVTREFGLALPAFILVALLFLVLVYTGNRGLGALENRFRIPGFEGKLSGRKG